VLLQVDLTRYDGTDFEFGSKFIEKMVNASQDPKLTTPPKRIAAIVSLALTVGLLCGACLESLGCVFNLCGKLVHLEILNQFANLWQVPNPKLVYNVHVEGVVAAQHHVPSAGPVGWWHNAVCAEASWICLTIGIDMNSRFQENDLHYSWARHDLQQRVVANT